MHASYGPDFNGLNDSAWVAVPAAIHVHGGSRGVHFRNCSFQRMAASALMFSGGSQDCSVDRCTFSDLSGTAVTLGQVDDWAEKNASKQNSLFAVTDNTMTRSSLEYRGCV
jgi:hypothetical protein